MLISNGDLTKGPIIILSKSIIPVLSWYAIIIKARKPQRFFLVSLLYVDVSLVDNALSLVQLLQQVDRLVRRLEFAQDV